MRSAGVLAALAATNIAAQRTRHPAGLVVPAGVAALVVMARAGGLGWEEMGLGREALRVDLPAAATAATVTAAGVGAVAMHPWTPDVGDLARYATPALARRAALGTIPLSVAVPEEIAFRGVLDASLRRHLSPGAADLAGALAFGAWHVLGATPVGPGGRGRLLGAAVTVAATTVAGLGFTALRRRSGSVLPGIAGHWALNGTAAVAAARTTS
ncbi:CPBP family intramembrane metalloprotease [Nostocoides sp. F2B08]|uniref:CPBP family intramembrane glutamic endopeptidase n=1 Tax=Nostocoides sp. F2B08 TaxID=2653936 RepID=UPI001262C500|nr:CPBP family intramembrane glutamic endopeptidase [Tetrasphaera sp. F2B08]KAB7745332.1 CPBP family intramembrane metalloprotease [Tetrasphaera sp. F2B08]